MSLKLGTKLGSKVVNSAQNGFELWRQLHREVDPAHPEESRGIVSRMRELFTGPAASTEALWVLILAQEKLNDEHLDKLARRVPEGTTVDNILFSLTAELAKDVAKDDVQLEKITYKGLRMKIADQREFERRFKPRNRGGDVDMGITSLARPGEGHEAAQAKPVPASASSAVQEYPLSPEPA